MVLNRYYGVHPDMPMPMPNRATRRRIAKRTGKTKSKRGKR